MVLITELPLMGVKGKNSTQSVSRQKEVSFFWQGGSGEGVDDDDDDD